MEYKNTLNLPQTDFPMKAELVTREPERLKKWETSGLYQKIQGLRANAEKFVLHDGPPFANGDVHIGNALNKILKDFVVKYKNLRGFKAPYVPGWDCHGLPIEHKVMKELRKAGNTASDPASIRRACDTYARKYIDIQRTQFKRLGVLGDWDHPYLTLDKEYEADELRLFADIVEQGFVYRGKKPVYWCIPCRTALADAEVEYNDHVSQSVYVKFPVVGQEGTFIVIWTTTPWTLPANLAVAYNSTFQYSEVQHQGEKFILSAKLLSAIAEKCGWKDYQPVRTLDGRNLNQLEYRHPFCNRTGKLFSGDAFVDNVTGTGFVHIAPGHGLEDYHLGMQQGLPIYSPVDDDGRFARTNDLPAEQQMPSEMLGKSILEKHGESEANEAVLHELRLRKALLHDERYHHTYPHCWRSKNPVIFRAMDQWFIEIDHNDFRKRALDEINRVNWVPDWGKNRIEAAVKGRPDWCISRQRTWGVPIPAFYDAQGNAILDAAIVRNAAELIEKHGSNIWFEQSTAELWATLKPAGWKGPEAATKSNDTLDVWIDSGSSSRAVIARREEIRGAEKPFQADMYLEGSDQHRGWFQSSLLLSLAGNGAAPYKTVLTHGFMVDEDRQKHSKSREYERPQTSDRYVAEFGADVIRLWVASQDFRSDIIVSEERIKTVGETYRIVRNALRFQLSNLYDFVPSRDAVPDSALTELDRWALRHFARTEYLVQDAYDDYAFHRVYALVAAGLVSIMLSPLYHDRIKDRLYTLAPNDPKRRSTQTALHRILMGLCKMLAPIIPFTADEAWCLIPEVPNDSVHLADWPKRCKPDTESYGFDSLMDLSGDVLKALEAARQSKQIGKSLDAKVFLRITPTTAEQVQSVGGIEPFREFLNVSQLQVEPLSDRSKKDEVTVQKAEGENCERCWHWETDVGSNPNHPTICGRCVKAIEQIAPLAAKRAG